MSPQELREDVSVLNVVNFGGGAYVIYAEVLPSGEIEVDPEPYSDTFDRPARLLPIEAKALVAAIDLLNLAQPELRTRAREGRRRARATTPSRRACRSSRRRVDDDDRPHGRAGGAREPAARARVLDADRGPLLASARSSPTRCSTAREALVRRRLGPRRGRLQHFRLDRIKSADALDEHFERRAGPGPDRRRRRLAAHRARSRARASRACGSRPSRRAGRARSAPSLAELDGRRDRRRAARSRASTSSSRRSSRRRATPRCSSPPTRARPCSPPPRACSPAAA